MGTHLGETGRHVPIQSSLSLEGPLVFEHIMHTVVEPWSSLPGSGGLGSNPPWTRLSRCKEGIFLVHHPQLPQLQLSLALGPKFAQASVV